MFKKGIWYPTQKRNRPGPDGPNASDWGARGDGALQRAVAARPLERTRVMRITSEWIQGWKYTVKYTALSHGRLRGPILPILPLCTLLIWDMTHSAAVITVQLSSTITAIFPCMALVLSCLHCSYGTFLFTLLLPSDIRVLLPTPKETYDLNLIKVTWSIWSFHIPTVICGTKNWYYLGSLRFPRLQHISQNMPEFAEM